MEMGTEMGLDRTGLEDPARRLLWDICVDSSSFRAVPLFPHTLRSKWISV